MSMRVLGNEDGGDDLPTADLVAFRSALRRLKTEGCNLLVAGGAPREVFTRASRSMLGDPDARRWRVFGLTDADPASVYDRLPAASAGPCSPAEATTIVDHALPAGPTADRAEIPVSSIPEVGVADLDEFRTALADAVRKFRAKSFRPAEVRLVVDSLAPLLDRYGFDAVREFLRAVGECVRDCDAMAHYVLPEPYDGDRCRRLADAFDAVVELRTAPTDDPASDGPTASRRAEERWHLPESGATMPWIPV